MNTTIVEKFDHPDKMSAEAAARIAAGIQQAVHSRGRAGLVLAGGNTPRQTYQMLATDRSIPWERVHLFWGDERWLPPEDPASNFFMVKQALLDRINLPGGNLHCPDFAAGSPQKAAALYDEEIRTFFGEGSNDGQWQYFDLTILGMGEDGHTASLFPGDPLLAEKVRYAAAVPEPAGKPPVPRISLTFPALARSRRILFLISGGGKAKILQDILAGENSGRYPAALVRAIEEVRWLVAFDPSAS